MILVLNLKMNLSKEKIIEYENNIKNKNVIVLPQYPYLALFNPETYCLGSQDVSEHIKGSYTGEVCAKCLKEMNCSYGLVNHSEREINFKENLNTALKKMNNLINNDIMPIYCINEIEKGEDIIKKLSVVEDLDKIIIAYEPAWLIGSMVTEKDIPYIKEELIKIKSFLKEKGNNSKLLYGGGINSDNINMIKELGLVEGFIISSNALDIDSLNEIYNKINN